MILSASASVSLDKIDSKLQEILTNLEINRFENDISEYYCGCGSEYMINVVSSRNHLESSHNKIENIKKNILIFDIMSNMKL